MLSRVLDDACLNYLGVPPDNSEVVEVYGIPETFGDPSCLAIAQYTSVCPSTGQPVALALYDGSTYHKFEACFLYEQRWLLGGYPAEADDACNVLCWWVGNNGPQVWWQGYPNEPLCPDKPVEPLPSWVDCD